MTNLEIKEFNHNESAADMDELIDLIPESNYTDARGIEIWAIFLR